MNGGAWEYVMGNHNRYSGFTAREYTAEEAKTILGTTNNQAVGIWNSGFNGPVYGKDTDGSEMSWTSGVDFPEEKYFDVYTTTSGSTACSGGPCYGHALNETSGWYGDSLRSIVRTAPWFFRGGGWNSPVTVGVFASVDAYGSGYVSGASRAILVPM